MLLILFEQRKWLMTEYNELSDPCSFHKLKATYLSPEVVLILPHP